MRIVVYPHTLSVGGSQLNAIELAASVRDRGHEVTIFAAESGPLADTIARLRLPLIVAPAHRLRPSGIIARALRDVCRRERIDIVHGYEWPPCVEGFYGPGLFDGIAVGCTVMSMAVAPFIPASIPLIVGTEQIAAAARVGRRRPVDVIEPPVDTDQNHPAIDGTQFRKQYGIGERPTIVVVSRLAHALKLEGIERAIGAAGLLAADIDVRLVIVGDGPARKRLSRAADAVNTYTGKPTVLMTGELADPTPAYAAADIILGMGGSALRAMAFAKPVVVLGELGFAKLLSAETIDTFLWQGFYGLGNGDVAPEELANILRPLLRDDEARRRLGGYSREFVEQRFSLKAAGERQQQLYEQWLATPSHRGWLAVEGASTALQLVAYKTRRRFDRWRGKSASEDFNTVKEISKISSLARAGRHRSVTS